MKSNAKDFFAKFVIVDDVDELSPLAQQAKTVIAPKPCDHVIGIHYDYSDTHLINVSDGDRHLNDVIKKAECDLFNFCPDCGANLKTEGNDK